VTREGFAWSPFQGEMTGRFAGPRGGHRRAKNRTMASTADNIRRQAERLNKDVESSDRETAANRFGAGKGECRLGRKSLCRAEQKFPPGRNLTYFITTAICQRLSVAISAVWNAIGSFGCIGRYTKVENGTWRVNPLNAPPTVQRKRFACPIMFRKVSVWWNVTSLPRDRDSGRTALSEGQSMEAPGGGGSVEGVVAEVGL